MTSFRRASIVFLAVVAFAAVLASANAKNVKFMVGNSNGNDIVLLDTKNHKLTTLVPTSAGLDFPDTMLAIPGKDRFLVATGDELADSKILIINAKNGRVIGRFDDGTLHVSHFNLSFSRTLLAVECCGRCCGISCPGHPQPQKSKKVLLPLSFAFDGPLCDQIKVSGFQGTGFSGYLKFSVPDKGVFGLPKSFFGLCVRTIGASVAFLLSCHLFRLVLAPFFSSPWLFSTLIAPNSFSPHG